MPGRVRAVVLNWNGFADTVRCIESLQKSDYPGVDIVIVDNGSEHNEAQRLAETFPTVQVLANPENRGFAGGCNDGMQSNHFPTPEYYLLLNNDAAVAPDAITKLVEALHADSQVGIVGATVYVDQSDRVYCQAGGYAKLWRDNFRLIGRNRTKKTLLPAAQVRQSLGYISGCCLLIRHTVCQQVGYFDEHYFAYFEETDLCRRAQRAGWKLDYAPKAVARHRVAATTKYLSATYLYYMLRNKLLFARSSLSSSTFLLYFMVVYAPRNIVGYLYLSLRRNRSANAKTIYGAVRDGLQKRYGRRTA